MVVLTEELVLAKTKATDLESVKNLNLWGSELTDVSILQVCFIITLASQFDLQNYENFNFPAATGQCRSPLSLCQQDQLSAGLP